MRNSTTNEQSPAFQFYASDWISDPSRMRMTLEEQGAYLLLYCHCWRGFKVPYDFEIMSKMCNVTENKINNIWPKISHLFQEVKTKDATTFLLCIQAEEERKEQAVHRARRSVAGKKGAEVRWGNNDKV